MRQSLTILKLLLKSNIVPNIAAAKQLVFNRKVSINKILCNSIYSECKNQDIVKIEKTEILIVTGGN